jgi:hypothetical protein
MSDQLDKAYKSKVKNYVEYPVDSNDKYKFLEQIPNHI